jgi:DNA-binding NtrC family response regulator
VILDIVMPVKGGIAALTEIKEIDSNALVYMTSGYVTGFSIDELMSKGAAGFINKPVTISDLSALVSGAITGKKKKDGDDSANDDISKA